MQDTFVVQWQFLFWMPIISMRLISDFLKQVVHNFHQLAQDMLDLSLCTTPFIPAQFQRCPSCCWMEEEDVFEDAKEELQEEEIDTALHEAVFRNDLPEISALLRGAKERGQVRTKY